MPAPRPTFTVTVDDPTGAQADIDAAVQANVQAAAAEWSRYLVGAASIEIEVDYQALGQGTIAVGGSASSAYVGQSDGLPIYQESVPFELATGRDVTGSGPDMTISVNPRELRSSVWLDPAPGADQPPADRADGVSVFAHEIGHALGILGVTGDPTAGDYAFTYDRDVGYQDGQPYFLGPAAEAVYGGPVPLAPGSLSHYDLPGLMNPVATNGVAVSVGPLDVAILSDAATPIGLPKPGTAGDDVVTAGSLPVVANLYGGDDLFYGSSASDFIYGGQGNDVLYGRGGNDVISGGPGTNILSGGAGADEFVVRAHGASDLILDFDASAGDRLFLGGQSYTVGAADDGSAVLSLSGGGSVTLAGIDPGLVNRGFFGPRPV